jgi:glycosyltransferase involved in cell wall biosynthesis
LCAEAFGRTVLEALSFGVPVIVSDRGALPQVIGEAGLVFPAGNEDELKKNIEKLLSDTELSDRLRDKGQELVQMYGQEGVINTTIGVYEKCISGQ